MGDVAHDRSRSCEPVILPPRGADIILGALPDIQPVGPVNHPIGIVAARLFPPFLRAPDLRQQFRAARGVPVFPPAQRLLHAGGLQRIQHRAGHVLLRQSRLDRCPAAPGRALHTPVGIRALLSVPPVMQPPAALRADRDTRQQMRRGAHHVLRRAGSANSLTSCL